MRAHLRFIVILFAALALYILNQVIVIKFLQTNSERHQNSNQTTNELNPIAFIPSKKISNSSKQFSNSSKATSKSPNDEFDANILEKLRICRVHPSPKFNATMTATSDGSKRLAQGYQCAGRPYEQFSNMLEDLIRTEKKKKSKQSWGQRNSILPGRNLRHNENGGQSILFMGNSHTRQLASTLLCQYKDQLTEDNDQTHPSNSFGKNASNPIAQFQFQNNLTIFSATNMPIFNSPVWREALENSLQRSLSTLDAIVIGRFNQLSESVGTNFFKMISQYQIDHPELGVDLTKFPGPTLEDLANAFPGTIIYVGMFAAYGHEHYEEAKRIMIKFRERGRRNIEVLDGRRYIVQLQQSHPGSVFCECSSDSRKNVGTCNTNTTNPRFMNGHRCEGARGGHSDPIAWDLVENFHKLSSIQGKTSTKIAK